MLDLILNRMFVLPLLSCYYSSIKLPDVQELPSPLPMMSWLLVKVICAAYYICGLLNAGVPPGVS